MIKIRKNQGTKCDCLTTETIINCVRQYGKTSDTYAPVYLYWVNDFAYKKSQNSSLKHKYTIADKVSLRFNNQDPDMIYVVNKEYIIQFMSLIFAIFSVVFYLLVSLLLSFHNHI